MMLTVILVSFAAVWIEYGGASHAVYSRNGNVTTDLVMIGAVLPIHQSLPNGSCGSINKLGIYYAEAIAYVIDMANKGSKFSIPGVTLGFEIHDSCSTVNLALSETLNLLSFTTPQNGFGISAMIGEFSSDITIPIAHLLNVFRIPHISFSATDSSLSDKSQFRYFLRTVPSNTYQAMGLSDIAKHFNWSYVAVVGSGDAYGKNGVEMFVENFRNGTAGRCIAGDPIEIPYPGATEDDYDKAVAKLTTPYVINATAVVVFAQLQTVSGLMDAIGRKRALDSNFTKQFVWIGSDLWTDVLSVQRLNIAQNVIGLVAEERDHRYFDAYFTSLNVSTHTDNPWFAEYWENYFNCSLNAKQNSLPPCDLSKQSLAAGYNKDILFLPHLLDAAHSVTHAIRDMQRVVCGNGSGLCSAALARGRLNTVTLDGKVLLQYLLKEQTQVSFDNNGDIVQAIYTVENFNGKAVVNIGRWVGGNGTTALDLSAPVVWNQMNGGSVRSLCSLPCEKGEYRVSVSGQSACCWTCRTCVRENSYSDGKTCQLCAPEYKTNANKDDCVPKPLVYNYLSEVWIPLSVAIAGAGIVITAVVACIVVFNVNNEVVVASSREILAFLFGGILFCYAMPFLFIASPSPAFCAMRRFGIGFCFSACFVPILVRAIRIHRIFNREVSTKAPQFTGPLSQVILVLVLLFVQVVTLTVWLVWEPPNVIITYDAQNGMVQCSENPYAGLSFTLGYNAIILVAILYFAFRTRKVPQRFNETKYISLTTCILIIIWIAFLPIYFGTASLGYVFQTSSKVLTTVLSATTVLVCFLFPKVYILLSGKRKKHHVSVIKSSAQPNKTSMGTSVVSKSCELKVRVDSGLPSATSMSSNISENNLAEN